LQKLNLSPHFPDSDSPFGDGHACEKIVQALGQPLPEV